jgi:hypothetical protein
MLGTVDDDSWKTTFRQIVSRSRFIVVDVSVEGGGLAFEVDYLRSMELWDRLILVHSGSSELSMVNRFRLNESDIPLIRYSVWQLRRFRRELRSVANRRIEAHVRAALPERPGTSVTD